MINVALNYTSMLSLQGAELTELLLRDRNDKAVCVASLDALYL